VSPLPHRVRSGLTRLSKGIIPFGSSHRAARKVAACWGRLASDAYVEDLNRVSWGGIAQIHLNHNELITGRRDVYWVEWMRDRYFHGGRVGDVLSLGCGAGHLDRIFAQCGYRFESFTGIDISAEAVQAAANMARETKVANKFEYLAADLNQHELPSDGFDFIYFFQSLHHIEALEWVLGQCHRALRPGGILMVNEFVGPSRFQWTPAQLAEANAVFQTLPEELRRDLTRGGVKERIDRPTVSEMLAYDPSEAVRAAEIEEQVGARFDIFEAWNWGGTLNHLVFQDIAGNFKPESPTHQGIIELLIHHENSLIRNAVLPSDFKVLLCRRT
jgi:SAM-dependent methyltransferase